VKPKPDNDETALFREAVRDVKPLPPAAGVASLRKSAPRPRFMRARRLAVFDEGPHGEPADPVVSREEALSFHRPGVSPSVMRKLRRGDYRVAGELDLHGLTVAQARQVLGDFLLEALHRRAACIRIIHGKGLRSGHRGPVLKSVVSGVLQRTSAVVAYVSARPVDGGTGALYVLLAQAP
jgi:DNA-nicking Smr family endonuclease